MVVRRLIKRIKHAILDIVESSHAAFRLSLRVRFGASRPKGSPDASWHNAVLQSEREIADATTQVRSIGLPSNRDRAKNWDSLAALDLIVSETGKDARIFDAGGERYSMIAPWLYLYGYEDLHVGNICFSGTFRRGSIQYFPADVTRTDFEPDHFDAITCLSVIEHGVDLHAYFRETARILKPGGVLVTSTDYFQHEVDTGGKLAYGVPIHIFTEKEIRHALDVAAEYGLHLTGPLETQSADAVVKWERFDLAFTFIVFSLRKIA